MPQVCREIAVAWFAFGFACLAMPRVLSGATPADILFIYSNERDLPANSEVERGLLEPAAGQQPGGLRVFPEYLGAPTFDGQAYEASTAAYLAGKYAARPPRVIVAGGTPALSFLLRHRQQVFPHSPVVYVAVDRNEIARRQLPADFVGVPVDFDFGRTLELALRLHPDAHRLLVVAGSGDWGAGNERALRPAVDRHAPALATEILRDFTTEALLERLGSLDARTVVVSPGYYQDAAGGAYSPRSSVELMAAASAAPVYSTYPTQLGTGIVGGHMTSFVEMGRATRRIIDQLLAGVAVGDLSVPASLPAQPHFDWRELQRWRIEARRLPAGSVIHYRPPTLWQQYRVQVLLALAVMLVQALLIAGLLTQRRLRRQAADALDVSEQRMDIASAAAQLTAFDLDLSEGSEAQFRQWLDFVHPADRERVERSFHQAAAEPGCQIEVEFRRFGENGGFRWHAVRGQRAAGNAPHFTGISMDISQRKEAELQAEADRTALTRLSRIALAGQLSAAIAHQLNQPLAAILGNAETACRLFERGDAADRGELREILDDIVAEDHRAAEIIRRLGALYKHGESELVEMDLNALVRETKLLMQTSFAQRHVHLMLRLEEPLPPVTGSRIPLQQVLLNLLLNAADAMAQIAEDQRQVAVRTWFDPVAGEVLASVADRGPGIAPEDLRRVFEPFWTTKAGGVGVGLAICQSIVKSHGGRIWAENAPGGGAVFSFALPGRAK